MNQLPFPSDALREIPIKLILSFAEKEPSLRKLVYPQFISSVSYILPELLIFDAIPYQEEKLKINPSLDMKGIWTLVVTNSGIYSLYKPTFFIAYREQL